MVPYSFTKLNLLVTELAMVAMASANESVVPYVGPFPQDVKGCSDMKD